jgi:hypothetical protein
MSFKPNFTGVQNRGETVHVTGRSDPDPTGDVLDIRIALTQGETIERAVVEQVGGQAWEVDVPVDGFVAGPATAFGIETRREHATTITWVQTVEIPAGPS